MPLYEMAIYGGAPAPGAPVVPTPLHIDIEICILHQNEKLPLVVHVD